MKQKMSRLNFSERLSTGGRCASSIFLIKSAPDYWSCSCFCRHTYTSLQWLFSASSATSMSYSSAAYFSQSETSWPSISVSLEQQKKQKTKQEWLENGPDLWWEDDPNPSCLTHPYDRERVPLLVVQVLLDVEESVKEDMGQFAPLEIPQGYLIYPM